MLNFFATDGSQQHLTFRREARRMKSAYPIFALLCALLAPLAAHARDAKVRPDPSTTAQPALQHALLDLDRQGRGPLDAAALAKFKALIAQYGWPTVPAAGRDAVDAAGDLLARSGADYDFQNECLSALLQRTDIDVDARAALTLNDRIEIAQGHAQQAGLLFAVRDGKVVLDPPLDSTAEANGLRGQFGLPTVAEDTRRLQQEIDRGTSAQVVLQSPRLSTLVRKGEVQSPALQAELADMVRKDQDARNAFIQSGMKSGSPEVKQLEAVDAANLTRIEAIFARYGFPDKALVGRSGVNDAWLLVQHAANDRPFMAHALELAKPLMEKGDLARSEYALLVDRVRLQQGKKQIYGSQLQGLPGHMDVLPLEDPAHVDQRRAEMGLQPLADYIRMTNAFYKPSTSKPATSASSPTTNKAASRHHE